jgi:RNA polymerase sigma-70 factor, ECF subfamily
MSALLGPGTTSVVCSAGAADRTRELYEQYGQRVFTFCYTRVRDGQEAQDAAQRTFIYAMRALGRGVGPEFELAWLLKIAFNVCRAAKRSARWRAAGASDGAGAVDELPDSSAVGDVERSARLEGLRDALRSLPESQQRAILLREWQGLSYAEIADELVISVGAVDRQQTVRPRPREPPRRLGRDVGAVGAAADAADHSAPGSGPGERHDRDPVEVRLRWREVEPNSVSGIELRPAGEAVAAALAPRRPLP